MWQHEKLSEQIHSWSTLACCWDVKQLTNNKKIAFSWVIFIHCRPVKLVTELLQSLWQGTFCLLPTKYAALVFRWFRGKSNVCLDSTGLFAYDTRGKTICRKVTVLWGHNFTCIQVHPQTNWRKITVLWEHSLTCTGKQMYLQTTASLALWLRRQRQERNIQGLNTTCDGIFLGRVIPVT